MTESIIKPPAPEGLCTTVLFGCPFDVVRSECLYETQRGVRFGDYSFGPHQCWSISVRTEDRDRFVSAFREWVHEIGGGVSSHGYDPNNPIVHFGVTIPLPNT